MKSASKKAAAGPLEGTWYVASLEVDGQQMPAAMLSGARVVVKGDRFESLGMGAVYEGKMTLDAEASPKSFDMTFTAGPEKGNQALAIYEVDGDEWKLCMTTRGGARPTRFGTAPGTGHALEILKRGQPPSPPAPATELPEAAAGAGPVTELEGVWSMLSGRMDGHPMEASLVKIGKRITRGSQTTVQFGPQVFLRATFTLDTAQSPRWIDMLHTEGMHVGKTQLAIYECDGQKLRLCSAAPGQPRPTDFESRKGDGRTLAEWKLEKK
ncbi:MAG TPA: TIGR03067 domain-containing protein [Bryobacteraceae bacterium]|nr:TIGR03067 domain-containing protein [Bryobacteraceae bacterium]